MKEKEGGVGGVRGKGGTGGEGGGADSGWVEEERVGKEEQVRQAMGGREDRERGWRRWRSGESVVGGSRSCAKDRWDDETKWINGVDRRVKTQELPVGPSLRYLLPGAFGRGEGKAG